MDNKYLNYIISSSIATVTAEIVTLPTCTIKTNYILNNDKILTIMKDIYKKYGLKGFYNSMIPSISSQVISTSTKFLFYRTLEDLNYEYSYKPINGAISGILSSLITHPIDFIKIHYQKNEMEYCKQLIKENSFSAYRGYSKSLSKVIIGSSLFFPIHEKINEILNNKDKNNEWNLFISAGLSAIISTTIMQPLDYLKIRHVYEGNKHIYSGLNSNKGYLIKYIKFIPILYKGYSINLLRIVPHFIITMTMIKYVEKHMNK